MENVDSRLALDDPDINGPGQNLSWVEVDAAKRPPSVFWRCLAGLRVQAGRCLVITWPRRGVPTEPCASCGPRVGVGIDADRAIARSLRDRPPRVPGPLSTWRGCIAIARVPCETPWQPTECCSVMVTSSSRGRGIRWASGMEGPHLDGTQAPEPLPAASYRRPRPTSSLASACSCGARRAWAKPRARLASPCRHSSSSAHLVVIPEWKRGFLAPLLNRCHARTMVATSGSRTAQGSAHGLEPMSDSGFAPALIYTKRFSGPYRRPQMSLSCQAPGHVLPGFVAFVWLFSLLQPPCAYLTRTLAWQFRQESMPPSPGWMKWMTTTYCPWSRGEP